MNLFDLVKFWVLSPYPIKKDLVTSLLVFMSCL